MANPTIARNASQGAVGVGLVVVAIFVAALHSTSAASTDYYVSPSGDDANAGTINDPFKTLERARNAVRSITSGMTSDITIYLRGGTHTRTATFALGAQDSGTNGFNVIYRNYPGETPVISGGRIVTGWVQEGDLWRASVGPGVQARQLYVNGTRAIRARSAAGLPGAQRTATGYITSDAEMQNWGNIPDVELVINSLWKQFHCGIHSIAGSTITMKQPCWDNANSHYALSGTERMRIENAYELLDAPGEWYLDRPSGRLYYKPRAGENIGTAQVILPVIETLLSAMSALDAPIHNVHFSGITFAYAGWTRTNDGDGFAEVQANWHLTGSGGFGTQPWTRMPAGIDVGNSQAIRFERNTIAHFGAAGLSIGAGAHDAVIAGNRFFDISGNGLMVGDVTNAKTTDPRGIPTNNQITNNYIHDVAVEYQGGVGIWIGYAQNTLVAHNELHDLPYTAISIGWGWGEEDPTIARDNSIKDNLIYDHVNTLIDGGGIYSLSAQPGNVYSGNVIQQQYGEYGAIYLDNRSRYITVNDNVVFGNTRTALIKSGPMGGDHYIHDNWWQDRYPDDIWHYYSPSEGDYIPTTPGPNRIENNHVITLMSQAPAAIVSNAGIESTYVDIRNQDPLPSASPPASPVVPMNPANVQVACTSAGGKLTVSWTPVKRATSYLLRIDDPSNNSHNSIDGWYAPGTTDLDIEITATAYTHTIIAGRPYRVWVNAKNNVGLGDASTSSIFFCVASTVVPCDFTVDEEADLIWRETQNGDVAAWVIEGTGVVVNEVLSFRVPLAWQIVGRGDVNGDGSGDLVWRHTQTGDVAVWLTSGRCVLGVPIVGAGVPLAWQIAGVGDVDGDGKADLVWRHTQTGDVAVWLMDGAAVKQGPVAASGVPLAWQIVAVDDLDGDDKADLIWRHTQAGHVAVWLMNGATVKQGPLVASGVPLTWQIVGVGDVDGDGNADLVWRHAQTGDVAAWFMNGVTVKQGPVVSAGVPLAWQIADVGDVDGDGKADLVWRHTQTGDVALWLMDGVTVKQGPVVAAGVPLAWQIQR